MVRFPETAWADWTSAASDAQARYPALQASAAIAATKPRRLRTRDERALIERAAIARHARQLDCIITFFRSLESGNTWEGLTPHERVALVLEAREAFGAMLGAPERRTQSVASAYANGGAEQTSDFKRSDLSAGLSDRGVDLDD